LTRRRLIGRGVVTAAGALIGRPAFAVRALQRAQPRIGVVGAGIAGLTASLTLHDAGYAATIVEAADAVGGRMHSNTFTWADGQTSEWCGEFIDSGHRTMRALAARFQLPTVDLFADTPPDAQETRFFFGRYYPREAAQRDFAPVYATIQEQLAAIGPEVGFDTVSPEAAFFDRMSVARWIDAYVPGGRRSPLGQLLNVTATTENGIDTDALSALSLIGFLGAAPALFAASDQRYHLGGGNQRLPEAIAAHLTAVDPVCELRLGWRMTRLEQTPAGVTLALVTPEGLHEEWFDHLILTVPFVVLRTLNTVQAGFDALKRQAIQELAYGTNTKLQLQFTHRFWNDPGPWPSPTAGIIVSDAGFHVAWDVTRGQPGAAGIVNLYSGGALGASFRPDGPYTTTDSAPVRAAVDRFLPLLDEVWPGASAHYAGTATLSYPTGDPHLLGSYSAYTLGQLTTFGGYEGVRQGRIHFAGEHCSREFPGFMEGAAAAGIRAAEEILADLERSRTDGE
jgi:monoamine oxidase